MMEHACIYHHIAHARDVIGIACNPRCYGLGNRLAADNNGCISLPIDDPGD